MDHIIRQMFEFPWKQCDDKFSLIKFMDWECPILSVYVWLKAPPPDTTLTVNSANITNHLPIGPPISKNVQKLFYLCREGLEDHLQNTKGFMEYFYFLLYYYMYCFECSLAILILSHGVHLSLCTTSKYTWLFLPRHLVGSVHSTDWCTPCRLGLL